MTLTLQTDGIAVAAGVGLAPAVGTRGIVAAAAAFV
jgi:hypothetical protein